MADCNQDFCAASASEPIGTSSGNALACNSKFIDKVANSQALTAVNRVGENRRTLKGLEADYIQTPINGGVWAVGVTYTAYNQYMVYLGIPYKAKFTNPLPYTTVNADATLDPGVEPYEFFTTQIGGLTQYEFATLADAKTGTSIGGDLVDLQPGMSVRTQGREAPNDGRGGFYLVAVSQPVDELGSHTLNNSNVILLQPSQEGIFAAQFGVLGQTGVDDAPALQAAVDYADAIRGDNNQGPQVLLPVETNLITGVTASRTGLVGQSAFKTSVYWEGGAGIPITKERANVNLNNFRFLTRDGVNHPDYWVFQSASSTGTDWQDTWDGLYFDRATVAAVHIRNPINVYMRYVRWNNAARLLECDSTGTAANNRVISIRDFTIDFTQNTGTNVPVQALVDLNMGNSDRWTLELKNGRIEGDISSISGPSLFNIQEIAPGTMNNRPLFLRLINCGFDLADVGTTGDTTDLLNISTTKTSVQPLIDLEGVLFTSNVSTLVVGNVSSSWNNPPIPVGLITKFVYGNPTSSAAMNIYQTPERVYQGANGVYWEESSGDLVLKDGALHSDDMRIGPVVGDVVNNLESGTIDVANQSGILGVDTEGLVATDDLDTINGGDDNKMIILHTIQNARTVVVKNGTGNIQLFKTGADISLDNRFKTLSLVYSNTLNVWLEL